jgi:flagellar basal-body rod protein FlgB
VLIRLFDGAVEHLTRGLAYASARHSVLAENIANAETPGYQARDLVFDDYLKPSVERVAGDVAPALQPVGTAGRHPRLVAVADGAARPDGNRVHLDRQMARLAENTLYQHTLVQVLAGQFNALKQAISGRV